MRRRMCNGLASTTAMGLMLMTAAESPAAVVSYAPSDWTVNSWGGPAPRYVFNVNDSICKEEQGVASYFKLGSRGGGSAEVVLSGVLLPGEAYSFTAWLKSPVGSSSVDIFFRRDNFPYETTAIRVASLGTDWKEVQLNGIHVSAEKGSIRIALRDADTDICIKGAQLKTISPSNVGSRVHDGAVQSRFFGIHLNRLGVHDGWPSFKPGILRLWDSGTTWALLQDNPGPIDWRSNVCGACA
jgi:hypothetical protein